MKIGKIVSIEFDKIRVRLFHTTRNSTVTLGGNLYYFGNIGNYLKTFNSSGETIVCEITSIVDRILDDKVENSSYNLDSSREIIMKPIGTLSEDKFYMGIGIFPSLYNDVEILTYEDLDVIMSVNKREAVNGIHNSILIGYSKNLINYEVFLDINRLFRIHTAVLGNSGSGKSNTIAHLLQEVYRKNDNYAYGAKTIIFDANGEYVKAFGEDSKLNESIRTVFYKLNINEDGDSFKRFKLPYYLMNMDEWLSFLMASERTQKPFWSRVLQETFKFYKIFSTNDNDTSKRYANYIKWKLTNILTDVVTKVDSDTSKITAARGGILKIQEIISTINEQKVNDISIVDDLNKFLIICNNCCQLNYGRNEDKLSSALNKFICPSGKDRAYVSYESEKVELSNSQSKVSFIQIDESDALKIDEMTLKVGDYYDYKYLKTAVDLVLLEEEAKGNLKVREFVSTMLDRLDYFLTNPDCNFMKLENDEFKSGDDYLNYIFGITDKSSNDRQLIIIDLSELGPDILELTTTVISRLIFDHKKHKPNEGRRKKPVHIILDEAHRYIQNNKEYIMRENIFEKIAREGRKYSLYLIVSSQRPSELSQTVLSQCGNYIVHRTQNEVDLKYIYSILPYFSEDFINKIKQSVPGEALIFGNCVPMPLMVKVIQANPSPNSDECIINKEWFTVLSNNDTESMDSMEK